MTPARITVLASVFMMTVLLGPAVTPTQAGTGHHEDWNEIFSLLQPEARGGGKRAHRAHFGVPRPVKNGQAVVNLQNGVIRFTVTGLPPIGGSSATMSAIGQIVKGTLVCHVRAGAGATLVDTPVVPVSAQGEATFMGRVPLPTACLSAANDLAFFVRLAHVQGLPMQP